MLEHLLELLFSDNVPSDVHSGRLFASFARVSVSYRLTMSLLDNNGAGRAAFTAVQRSLDQQS